MKNRFTLMLLGSIMAGFMPLAATNCDNTISCSSAGIRSIFIPRSVGANVPMEEFAGWQDLAHQYDIGCFYGALAGRFEYTRSFRPERIAEQLFGTQVLRFQGSQVPGRSNTSLIADNFGLPTNFDGSIRFKPVIENFIFNWDFYAGLDGWLCGLYFEAHFPLVHTRWSLFDTCDTDCSAACNINCGSSCNPSSLVTGTTFPFFTSPTPFPAGYMSVPPTANPEQTVSAANNILQALSGDFLFGDMQERWNFGRFTRCRQVRTRLADIDLMLGWDFFQGDWYHLGLFVQAVAPTGGKNCEANVFSPVIGSNGHWGLGGGLSGHITLWSGPEDANLSIGIHGNAIHFFKNHQVRSFDFKGKPLSRYLLLKEFDQDNNYIRLINAINFTTRVIETSIGVQGDAAINLAYRNGGLAIDVGYNIYGQTAERGHLRGQCDTTVSSSPSSIPDSVLCATTCTNIDNRRFGIKGCQGVAADIFTTENNGTALGQRDTTVRPNPIPLNSTESNATAFTCGTIDNRQAPTLPAGAPASDIALAFNSLKSPPGTPLTDPRIVRAFASNPPVLVSVRDLDFCSGLGKSQLTHKVYGYIGYIWETCGYTPFIGILGEVEFDGSRRSKSCDNTCNTATTGNCNATNDHIGLNQWGIGVKLGMSF